MGIRTRRPCPLEISPWSTRLGWVPSSQKANVAEAERRKEVGPWECLCHTVLNGWLHVSTPLPHGLEWLATRIYTSRFAKLQCLSVVSRLTVLTVFRRAESGVQTVTSNVWGQVADVYELEVCFQSSTVTMPRFEEHPSNKAIEEKLLLYLCYSHEIPLSAAKARAKGEEKHQNSRLAAIQRRRAAGVSVRTCSLPALIVTRLPMLLLEA